VSEAADLAKVVSLRAVKAPVPITHCRVSTGLRLGVAVGYRDEPIIPRTWK